MTSDNHKPFIRHCPRCNKEIHYTRQSRVNQANRLGTTCMSCARKNNTNGYKRSYEWLMKWIEASAKNKKLDYKLTYDDILNFIKITECHYCGDKITWLKHRSRKDSGAYNLDRMDNNKGYVKENLCVCCTRCNFLKSNEIGYKTMLQFGKILKNEKV